MEEVEEFKYLGVWVDRKLRDNVLLEKVAKKGRRVDWKGDMDERSEWEGRSRRRKDGAGASSETKNGVCSRSVVDWRE